MAKDKDLKDEKNIEHEVEVQDEKSEAAPVDEEVTKDVPEYKKAAADAEPGGEVMSPTLPLPPPKRDFKAFLKSKKGRIILAITGILVLVGILLAVPTTRYAIAGMVLKKEVTFTLQDIGTNKPISDAEVSLAGQTAKSDNQGKVQFKSVPVGPKEVTVKKKYYKDHNHKIEVWITKPFAPTELKLEATGRQVTVKTTNKISGKPIAKAVLSALDSTTITDEKGEAVIVLPADQKTVPGVLKLGGFNDQTVEIKVTDQPDQNNFALTPSGKLYFLSKRTGKINVMKSNLDGSDPQIVVPGTGKEEDRQTVLLASRDWKYLALKSRRDSEKPKLYLIDTSNDKLTVMDEGEAEFTPVGWSNEYFIYTLVRNKIPHWQPKHQALKSFNAKTAKLTTLDETQGVGDQNAYGSESLSSTYILDNLLIYAKDWNGYSSHYADKKIPFVSIKPNGENRKTLKEISEIAGIYEAKLYKPQEVYFKVYAEGKDRYYEYEDGKVSETTSTSDAIFNQAYPTFLYSPSGNKTFWSESRDGKNTLFTGGNNAQDPKEIASLSAYVAYGWFTDEYLLVSKDGSELYIMPASELKALKVTDYHKPDVRFDGYGYGYGGF